ncbi:MAG: hypothetical protein FJ096_21075, partial [Deltaproteobacteria bacterium]|nr:hypothetical protein [Deltaproteobacteria bacterium]
MLAPIALRPDNFTPPSRTPWGGTRLLSRYKACVTAHPPIVGESWEISVEPSFPSLTREGARLDACIAQDPVGWLGPEGAA